MSGLHAQGEILPTHQSTTSAVFGGVLCGRPVLGAAVEPGVSLSAAA